MASSETIRHAAFIAAVWDIETEEVRRLAEQDRLAALEGFVAATTTDTNRVWALMLCLDLYSVEELEQAGAPEFAVERRQMQLEPTEEQLEAQREAQQHIAQRRAEREKRRLEREAQAEKERPLTLGELLGRERSENLDVGIAHHSQLYASQVADLTEEQADDLRRRLDDWWPDKPYANTITHQSENSWMQENFAAAWLWFGPALDKNLTTQQWAELASCGLLFHDQMEWLKRKATPEAKLALARTCTAEDTRVWHQALQVTPDPLPEQLVEVVVQNLDHANEEVYAVDYIGQRLYEAAGAEPLRQLSAVSQQFADALRPLLAADGDEEAQAILVKDLHRRLEAGERRLDRTLGWLDAADSEDLLDDLFACVSLVYGPSDLTEPHGSWYPSDVLTPVMSAIRNIGGRKAVAGYDKLLEDPDNAFLRGQRDAIAQAMRQADGLEAAEEAARELGLPFFASSR